MEERELRTVPIDSLSVEDGAQELVRSEKMKPYHTLLQAQMSGQDTNPPFEALAALPLEERYVWRVNSASKWAFCDLETESLIADLRTLSVADLKRLVEPLQMRTIQFSIFILTMLGSEAGEQLILEALNNGQASLWTNPSE